MDDNKFECLLGKTPAFRCNTMLNISSECAVCDDSL